MLGFVIGLMLGGFVGIATMAILQIFKSSDKDSEKFFV